MSSLSSSHSAKQIVKLRLCKPIVCFLSLSQHFSLIWRLLAFAKNCGMCLMYSIPKRVALNSGCDRLIMRSCTCVARYEIFDLDLVRMLLLERYDCISMVMRWSDRSTVLERNCCCRLAFVWVMTNNVFVYGSLLADEVVQKLLSRMPKALPGMLRHLISAKSQEVRSFEWRALVNWTLHVVSLTNVSQPEVSAHVLIALCSYSEGLSETSHKAETVSCNN